MTLTPRIDRIGGRLNKAINGAFDFWQRGVGPTAIPAAEFAAGYYLADRYNCRNETGTGAANSLRSGDVPAASIAGFNFPYSLEVDITTAKASLASGDSARFKTTLEGYDTGDLVRNGFRCQFWVKSNKTGKYAIWFFNSGSTRRYSTTYNINTADSWELKTIDLPAEVSGTWATENTEGLQVSWFHAAGNSLHGTPTGDWLNPLTSIPADCVNLYDNTANYWRITGISLVPGVFSSSAVIPFVRAGRNIAEELIMCQRYYEKSYSVYTVPGTLTSVGRVFSVGRTTSTSTVDLMSSVYFKVSKRSSPTITAYRPTALNTTGAESTVGVIAGGDFGTNNSSGSTECFSTFIVNQAGLTVGQAHSAYFHFTADIEL